MNKFRRFLFRISTETCLKMDYFASKFPKSPPLEAPHPDHRWDSITIMRSAKTLLPLNIFDWCRCFGNFGEKWNLNLYFMFSGSASSLSKNRSCATEGANIYRRYKQIHHLKNWNIARNKICFIYECFHC